MAFNIKAFNSNLARHGVIHTNHFDVIINPPPALSGLNIVNGQGAEAGSSSVANMLTFRTEQVRIPGVALDHLQVSRYGIGPKQKMPTNARYTDNNLTFMVDRSANIWSFWYQWMNYIMQFAGNDGSGNGNTLPSYTVAYKDQYAVLMQIIQYDAAGQPVQTFNIYDAFPIAINDTPLSWNATNQLLKMTVTMSFKEFTIVKSTTQARMPAIGSGRNTIMNRATSGTSSTGRTNVIRPQ